MAEVLEVEGSRQSFRATWMGRFVGWCGACLALLLLLTPLPARAASSEDAVLDAAALGALEMQAAAAQPRDQCFLFSEVVRSLTEEAGREIAAGQEDQAQLTLKHADAVLVKMHAVVQGDAKRLKNAEMLMQHASRRLSDMLHVAGEASRVAVQSTLQKLNALHNELLTQLFSK